MVVSEVHDQDVPFLKAEIQNLLAKGAVEVVRPKERENGFYSRYFLVTKKDSRSYPIVDLHQLNRALGKLI